MWACTDRVRNELKDDLKQIAASLAAMNTNMALMQQTLTAQQATLTAQQAALTVQQATLKGLPSKLDVGMLLVLGLLGTAAVLHMPK